MLTGKQRLERLRVVMANIAINQQLVKSGKFDMTQWFHACGTPSCAAGWGSADRVLKAEGLVPRVSDGQPKWFTLNDLGLFFGLDYANTDDVEYIFTCEGYDNKNNVTPADVIEHIDAVLSRSSY